MNFNIKSIRTFIGAKNYSTSRQFYQDLGFEEIIIAANMSFFKAGNFGFYLQDYYQKKWVHNSMVFLEVEDLENHLEQIKNLRLTEKYSEVKISEIHYKDWGAEFFMHDPAGVLWHIGNFKS